MASAGRLFFCLLYELEADGEMGLRLLNEVELPPFSDDHSGQVAAGGGDSLQFHLTDGPYVMLFERTSRMATVLKLHRPSGGCSDIGFRVWRKQVDVMQGIGGDASTLIDVVSCAYINEEYGTKAHLLVHAQRLPAPSSTDSIPGITGANTCNIRENVEFDSLDDGQLLKRSVVVMQKQTTPEMKLSCHRLRLREGKKHGPHSKKRSRNDEKGYLNDDTGSSNSKPFLYIERTQKASSHDRSLNIPEDTTEDVRNTASPAQLATVSSSLETRLGNGVQELERLHLIVNDKCSLANQLNQIIIEEWRKTSQMVGSSKKKSPDVTVLVNRKVENRVVDNQRSVDMETVVTSSTQGTFFTKFARDVSNEQASVSPLDKCSVSLEYFRVLDYAPSSSLVRAEVVLNNLSDSAMADSFVVLAAPQGGWTLSTQGWTCSSSVVPEFSPRTVKSDSIGVKPSQARFQIELHFAPTFTSLRAQQPVVATVWLHWGAYQNEPPSTTTSAKWQLGVSAIAVASVKVSTKDLLRVTSTEKSGLKPFTQQGTYVCGDNKHESSILTVRLMSFIWFRARAIVVYLNRIESSAIYSKSELRNDEL
ncbi:unnamed protein product [Phytophthora fragariaefolia]|uniref:Unnamed protein product n=1 Tax=Phytophthora fragariaefolia TaxID=1490495 RepID=A0A9W7D390_9STRA|nr:unnamed protein product [Phytophthora fragariaefolia]